MMAAEPAWNAAAIKECDPACLVGFMSRYMDASYWHDPRLVPPSGTIELTVTYPKVDFIYHLFAPTVEVLPLLRSMG